MFLGERRAYQANFGVANLRVLYLTKAITALSEGGFAGRKVASALPGEGGAIMVRHWMAETRAGWSGDVPDVEKDVTDRGEFDAFAPDVIYCEGGLYSGKDNWKIPPEVVLDFVASGGVFIVTDVHQNRLMLGEFEAYNRDIRFFGAELMGAPDSHFGISYVRDEKSNEDNNPGAVLCPKGANSLDWTSEAFEGVERVLAVGPVAVDAVGTPLVWTAPTADVLSSVRWVLRGQSVPIATVSQHGFGYAAMIFAAIDSDEIVTRNPDNIRWICNLASLLHDRARTELRLRGGQNIVTPPTKLSPYGDRPTVELVAMPEDHHLEHKQTLRYDVRKKEDNPSLEEGVMNRICGFWNAEGGTLLIGVEDRTGRVTGLGPDLSGLKDKDEDELINRLTMRLRNEVPLIAPFVRIRAEPVGADRVLRIEVPAGDKEVFRQDRFYARMNNSTPELKGQPLLDYIRRHFGGA